MSLFFIHGGPGFNSQPDRLVLSNTLASQGIKAVFWDEPSVFRPEGSPFSEDKAYLNWLNDLRGAIEKAAPRLIVASSFGAKGLIDLIRLYPQTRFQNILFVGPTLNMEAVFKRMMEISEKDLEGSAPDIAHKLRERREGSQKFWDASMQEGLGLVWQNPKLLTHYFADHTILALWAGVGADPRFAIDMGSQKAVLDHMATLNIPRLANPLNVSVTVLSGDSDPVFNKADVEKELMTVFSKVHFEKWMGCGHFPHLEKPKEFIEFAKGLMK